MYWTYHQVVTAGRHVVLQLKRHEVEMNNISSYSSQPPHACTGGEGGREIGGAEEAGTFDV